MNLVKTVLEYLKHASTWKGIIAVVTALGVTLSPELQAAVVSVGLSLIGLVQIFVDDRDVDKS